MIGNNCINPVILENGILLVNLSEKFLLNSESLNSNTHNDMTKLTHRRYSDMWFSKCIPSLLE